MIRSRASWTVVALALLPLAPLAAQLTGLGATLFTECAAPGDCGEDDVFGSALAVGDFDADGYDDLAVGVPGETQGGDADAGAVHVYYGSIAGLRTAGEQIFHQDVSGIAGVTEPGDYFGDALAVGDFDLDGYDDLAIGIWGEAIGDLDNAGAVAVLFGGASGLVTSGSLALTQDDLPAGSSESAEADDRFGWALASDGGAGLAVGASAESFLLPNETRAGLVHVFGRSGAGNALNTVTDRTQNDFLDECGLLDGNETNDNFGHALVFGEVSASAPSLIVAAPWEDLGDAVAAGRVTVMFGAASGCFDQGTSGVAGAPEDYDYFGSALATGDFDGDGYADLAVGVPEEDLGSPAVTDAGGVNVLYGTSGGLTSSGDQFFSQEVLSGDPGTLAYRDEFGAALATGDFDGDGYEDLAIGVPGEGSDYGQAHVIYGSASGLATAGTQTFSSNTPGIPDNREQYDRFGSALAAGDFDGNGVADLAIGVPGEGLDGAAEAGEAIVVYGMDRSLGAFGTVRFPAGSDSVGESDGLESFVVTRDGSGVLLASVDRPLAGGTATPGVDFTYTASREEWEVGDLGFEAFTLTILQDSADEPNETIVIALADPSAGLAIGAPSLLTITLVDDDPAGQIFADGFEGSGVGAWSSHLP